MDNFGIYIVSHGKPNDCWTADMILNSGYSGDVWIVLDDEDPTIDLYRAKYGDRIVVFNKDEMIDAIDTMSSEIIRKVPVYGRQASLIDARQRGYKFYSVWDDDIRELNARFINGDKLDSAHIGNIQELFEAVIEFLEETNAGGFGFRFSSSFIGGQNGPYKDVYDPVMTQSFFLPIDAPDWRAAFSEDFVVSMDLWNEGRAVFSWYSVSMNTPTALKGDGGAREEYDKSSRYSILFPIFLAYPSVGKFRYMKNDIRLFRNADWTPKILSDRWKK